MLKGKIALVTGASRGIGRAIALKLGSLGATVIGTATTSEGAAKICEYFDALTIKGEGAVLEVCDQSQIDTLIPYIEKTYGTIAILVNNAGITRDNLSMRMKEEEWDAVIHTNLKGIFNCTKVVSKLMMKQRYGRIVNMTSVVGVMGNAGQSNYAAAKAGVIGFTKSMAKELASRNINVNAVAPGYISTDMTANLPEQARLDLQSQIPLQRLGNPEDVAAAVLFLVSPGADYITGQTLHVDGGMVM